MTDILNVFSANGLDVAAAFGGDDLSDVNHTEEVMISIMVHVMKQKLAASGVTVSDDDLKDGIKPLMKSLHLFFKTPEFSGFIKSIIDVSVIPTALIDAGSTDGGEF